MARKSRQTAKQLWDALGKISTVSQVEYRTFLRRFPQRRMMLYANRVCSAEDWDNAGSTTEALMRRFSRKPRFWIYPDSENAQAYRH